MFEKLSNLINKNPILKLLNQFVFPLPFLAFGFGILAVYVVGKIFNLI
jgi:hypothetical protein